MHQQAHLANNQQMQYPPYGHPQHFSHQPVGSHSHSPNQQAGSPSSNFIGADNSHLSLLSQMSAKPQFRVPADSFLSRPSQIPDFSKTNGGYEQYLTYFASQGMYSMPQPGLDPNYTYYPQYPMHQQMQYPNAAPPSPRPGYPQVAQGFMPGGYGNPQHAQGMSRTSSQISERPASTIAAPQTPLMSNANHVSHTHTPSVGTASPAPSSNFTIPKPKSKAIVIKNADGEVLDFAKQKAASPAPPPTPRSPAIASTPTPPPRVPSANESLHSRTESVANKTAEERKAEFMEQFQKQIKADKVKEEAETKAKEDKEAKDKLEADAKAAKEKEEGEAKAAKEKEAEEKAKAETEAAEKAKKEAEEAERLKREEDERMEREIAEMEELERQEEERERAFQEKRKKEKEEHARKEAEKAANAEEEMRKAEREAEALEEAREKARETATEETPEEKAEREKLFASLAKSPFAPAASESPATPAEPLMPPPAQPKSAPNSGKSKPVPHPLKIETNKPVEPAQPTAGMQALKSARFLQIKNEAINYPEGIKSPNPALNQGGKSKGRQYDKDFLLQFQEVFREKPSTDWELKLKETVGDSSDSARPQSARTSMGGMGSRGNSRPSLPTGLSGGTMGMFSSVGGRTLRPGTTSEERFQASQGQPARAPTMSNPLAQFANRPGGFPMGGPPQMARTGSFQNMSQNGPNSPRNASSRGKGSRRGPGGKRDEEIQAKQMPLTAGLDLKPLEKSTSGWKPMSIGAPPAAQIMSVGHMPPDMVQRKVKAALNKMTPEKFDRIADQILEIAAQSKEEPDGRTLRQVIQLTFEKACDEAHWASMYAKFCKRMLETMSADIKDENVRDKAGNPVVGGALFRKYLLNRCQEEFERGWEVNLPQKPEGESQEAALLSDEYYIAAGAKRKGLGLIQFIGELYKLGMLTLRIMHECVLKLLDFEGTPDESAIESLVKLLKTVGYTMENTDTGPKMIQLYFERIQKIMSTEGLPSRMHFMLLDTVDLRKKGWRSKDDSKGPKTLQEIHQEALAATQAAEMERSRSNRGGGNRQPMGRGDTRSFSGGGMMPPPEYNRNQVGMDDLRKLTKNASGRNLSNSPAQLGPSSLFGSRSSSGRKGLGPSLMNRADDSGASSRTGTPPVQKEKESTTHVNSFRYFSFH
jgi:translation initiation factor 4G